MSTRLAGAALIGSVAISGGAGGRADAAPAPDAFDGTWTLLRSRSAFEAQPVPASMSITIDTEAEALHYRSTTHGAGNAVAAAEFTAALDGTLALVVGPHGFLAPVALHRIDATTIEATYSIGLKQIAASRWSIDATGDELQVRTTYLGNDGRQRENLAVFVRALPPKRTVPP